MPNSITSAGITTSSRSELLAYFTQAYESIYGSDINLDSNSPDGQWMNIQIQAILDIQDWIVQAFNSFDPDFAIGVILDQRCAINGVQRQGGTYTTTYVEVVNSQIVTLYGLDQTVNPVYTVSDSNGNQWQLLTTQTDVAAGTNSFLFQAATPGQVLTVPNTITTQVTVVLGVDSVNNPNTYATLGINEESDVQLKIRRAQSVSIPSQGYYQGLKAALLNINGISAAIVHENNTDTVDDFGVDPHSIWVIVAGSPSLPLGLAWNAATVYQYGSIASYSGVNYISVQNNNLNNLPSDPDFWQIYSPVAQAIYAQRNAGCGMYAGNQSYNVVQYDGTVFTVYWSTVVSENLYIKFNTSSLNLVNPPDIAAITSALEAFPIGVYQEINVNQIAAVVVGADPNTLATNIGLSASSGGSFTNTLTPTTLNYQFVAVPIILPIILTCPNGTPSINGSGVVTTVEVSCASGGATIQFTPLGGLGVAMSSPYVVTGSGSINSSGLYTSAGAGTDTVTFTDSLGNVATATVTVT